MHLLARVKGKVAARRPATPSWAVDSCNGAPGRHAHFICSVSSCTARFTPNLWTSAVQNPEVNDTKVDSLVANKKRIRYTRRHGWRQKARAPDRGLHPRSTKIDAVGREKLACVGVCHFRCNSSGRKDHGQDWLPLPVKQWWRRCEDAMAGVHRRVRLEGSADSDGDPTLAIVLHSILFLPWSSRSSTSVGRFGYALLRFDVFGFNGL